MGDYWRAARLAQRLDAKLGAIPNLVTAKVTIPCRRQQCRASLRASTIRDMCSVFVSGLVGVHAAGAGKDAAVAPALSCPRVLAFRRSPFQGPLMPRRIAACPRLRHGCIGLADLRATKATVHTLPRRVSVLKALPPDTRHLRAHNRAFTWLWRVWPRREKHTCSVRRAGGRL
ncbi:hypothetical protein EJ04DRAFT_337042 [Polyplosphaeria fusca]|uniref:Uncharacterized protein n=1 Tax=Polyplosphaeria fusca TaxID=682080 RepID=A0A9P4V0R2_9PLEO|nr:hypothetical protein EJ04DRAFT_337042 [Polyplosphaeria fusca]